MLVVEDDRTLRWMIASALRGAGHGVLEAADGLTAVDVARREAPDIVLVDLGLPVADGWHVLRELGGSRAPAIIVISARGDEAGKVRALDLGADDYLAKPFGADELVARVRAVLRRTRQPHQPSARVAAGAVVVDLGARVVTRGGAEVALSPTEYALLAELARHPGAVVDHAALLAGVWGPDRVGERTYLRTFVQRLRAKLEDVAAEPAVVVTVGRRGYRFGGPAAEAPPP